MMGLPVLTMQVVPCDSTRLVSEAYNALFKFKEIGNSTEEVVANTQALNYPTAGKLSIETTMLQWDSNRKPSFFQYKDVVFEPSTQPIRPFFNVKMSSSDQVHSQSPPNLNTQFFFLRVARVIAAVVKLSARGNAKRRLAVERGCVFFFGS